MRWENTNIYVMMSSWYYLCWFKIYGLHRRFVRFTSLVEFCPLITLPFMNCSWRNKNVNMKSLNLVKLSSLAAQELTVQPVTKMSSKWQYFRFCENWYVTRICNISSRKGGTCLRQKLVILPGHLWTDSKSSPNPTTSKLHNIWW